MHWLHIRTEQLVVGAALAARAEPEEAVLVQAGDFHLAMVAELYTAILRLRAEHPGADTATLAAAAAQQATNLAITGGLLGCLAAQAAAADPGDLRLAHQQVLAYGSQRAIRRELKDIETGRQRQAAYARLGLALHRAQSLDDRFGDPDLSDLHERWLAQRDTETATAQRYPEHAAVAVLAGLLNTPQMCWPIAGWLPEQAFADPLHRAVYALFSEDRLARPDKPTISQIAEVLARQHIRRHLEFALDMDTLEVLLRQLAATNVSEPRVIKAALTLWPATDGPYHAA